MLSERKHCYEYDILRILGMILVVMGHASYYRYIYSPHGGIFYQLPENVSSFYLDFPSLSAILFSFIYSFHMPLFFMLSGAMLAMKPRGFSLDAFVAQKLRRLILPYCLVGYLFMIPVRYLGGYYSLQGVMDTIPDFLSGSEAGHLWFLPALFWASVIFVLLLKLTGKRSIFISVLLAALLQLIGKNYMSSPAFGFQDGLCHIFWLAVGYCFEKYRCSWKEYYNSAVLAGKLLFFTGVAFFNFYFDINTIVSVFTNSYWLYLLSLWIAKRMKHPAESKLLKVLAASTFTVYLLHDPLELLILRAAFALDWLTTVPGCIFYYFLRSVGVYCICVVAFLLGKWLQKKCRPLLLRYQDNAKEKIAI